MQHILVGNALRPHKVRYYLECRYPNFSRKMREVLLVYQEVALQNNTAEKHDGQPHGHYDFCG